MDRGHGLDKKKLVFFEEMRYRPWTVVTGYSRGFYELCAREAMKQKERVAWVGSVVLLTAAVLLPSSAFAVSLKEAVELALQNYPTMQQARYERQAIQADLDTAKARYLPTLDLTAGYGREWSDNDTTQAAGYGDGRWMNRTESSLRLTETLFDGHARSAAVEEQEALLEGAKHYVLDRGDTIGSDVASAYIDVLRYNAVLELANDNLKTHERILDNVRSRVEAGQSGIGDLQQARARQASAEARIAEVQADLDKARIKFKKLVGILPDQVVAPEFDDAVLPPGVEMAVQRADERSSLIKRERAKLEAARARLKGSAAGKYPTFLLEVGGTANDSLDGTPGRNNDFQAMLRMQMNLFRGGADSAKERAAAERYSESMASLAETRRQVEEEVRRAWSSVERKDQEVEGRQAEVVANGQVSDIYQQEFDVGQRDLLDLLDAENELFNSRTRLLAAQHSALYARFLLLATMGELVNHLGIDRPELASSAE